MADRALRGMRLGSQSMENTHNADLAERNEVTYDCPAGHSMVMPFSIEADVPLRWGCHCGLDALLRNGEQPEPLDVKAVRTHWDMLMERRTEDELQELLQERLDFLRASRGERVSKR